MSKLKNVKANWTPLTESECNLPPRKKDDDMWSEKVWLALGDGTVKQGECLFASSHETYKPKVHDWRIDGRMNGSSYEILAWLPLLMDQPTFKT